MIEIKLESVEGLKIVIVCSNKWVCMKHETSVPLVSHASCFAGWTMTKLCFLFLIYCLIEKVQILIKVCILDHLIVNVFIELSTNLFRENPVECFVFFSYISRHFD